MLKRLLIALLCCAFPALAVDSLTVTGVGGQFSKIEWNWTADGSGNASGVTTDVCPGVLFSFSTVPDTVQVPTDNYDITIKNQLPSVTGSDVTLATDLAGGLIADRDNVNTELVEFWPTGIRQSSGKIRLDISNAGSGKKGKAVLVIYRTLAIVSTSGSFQLPIGGATTQMLQWFSSGQAKWITLSGDATIANGGAITIANGAITRAKTAITGTPTGSKFLRDDWSWQAPGGGSGVGDVVGPASATNGGIVLFDLTTGKLIKDSTYTFPLADAQVADTLTASIFKGTGSTTDAVDLATAEVSGTLPDGNVADALTISGGTVNNSVIGGSTPAAATVTTLTASSTSALQNTVTVGTSAASNGKLVINGQAASHRLLEFHSAGVRRWFFDVDNSTESGSNSGSKIILAALDDSGNSIDYPISIVRASGGTFSISRPLDVASTIEAGSSNTVLTNSTGTLKQSAIEQNSATTGQYLAWNGSAWAPTTPTAGPSSSRVIYWEDFLGAVLPSEWVNTASGTGAGGVFGLDPNGIYEVQGGTGTNSNDRLTLGDYATVARPWQRGKNVTAEVGLVDSSIDTGDTIFIGFFYDTYPYEGVLTNKARMCFALVDGSNSNKWIGVTADGTTTTNGNTTVSPGGAQILKIVASSSNVKFYINGTLAATNTTNLPTTTTSMFFCVQTYNTNGGTNPKAKVDYVSLSQDR